MTDRSDHSIHGDGGAGLIDPAPEPAPDPDLEGAAPVEAAAEGDDGAAVQGGDRIDDRDPDTDDGGGRDPDGDPDGGRESIGGRVARNAGFLMASQIVSWGFASIENIVLPRHYGPEAAGFFYISFSLWAIGGLIAMVGTDIIINRRVARGEKELDRLVGSALGARIVMHLLVFAGLTAYVLLADYSRPVVLITIAFGVSNLFHLTGSVFDSVLLGMQRMRPTSIIAAVGRMLQTLAILTMILLDRPVEQVAYAGIGASVVLFALRFRAVRAVMPVRPRFDLGTAIALQREGAPVMANRLSKNLYVQLDIIILSWLVAETTVGWYAVADILFGTLLFMPNVAGAALFPAVARLHVDNPSAGQDIVRRVFHLLLVMAVPMGVGVAAVASGIVELLYGAAFAEAAVVLAVFGPVITLTSLTTIVGYQLIATDRERQMTRLMIAALSIALPIDLLLIVWTDRAFENGAIGGALAYIVTEGLILIGGMRLLPSGTFNRTTLWLAMRVGVAAAVMGAVAFALRDRFLVVPIIAGGLVYLALVLPLRLISERDRRFMLDIVRGRVRGGGAAPRR